MNLDDSTARPAGYPAELERVWQMPGGPLLTIRALRPDDLERETRFIEGLSRESLYQRLQYHAREVSSESASRLLDLDYVDTMAIAAIDASASDQPILGVSRYARIERTDRAECAIVVSDAWQGRGLGTELMHSLAVAARARGIVAFVGLTLGENARVAAWARRFGCPVATEPNSGGLLKVTLDLTALPS